MGWLTTEFSKENISMSNAGHTYHLLGLSHLPLSKEYASCAFTLKNIKMAKMLCDLNPNNVIYYYGAKTTNPKYNVEEYVNSVNFHFIETHNCEDISKSFGSGCNLTEIGYDWSGKYSGNGGEDYRHDLNSAPTLATLKFYANAIEHISKVKKPDDYLLCTQGAFHRPIADAVKLFLTCEAGIGYRAPGQGWYRCFESAYIQNYLYASESPFASLNGSFQDVVIGNYFDPDDVEFSAEKDDYFLFCARLIRRKGILEAYETSKAVGKKLIIAGQGGRIAEDGSLVSQYEGEFRIPNDGTWEYVGFQSIEQRKKLMARARALFSVTIYIECFAGVHCEAMLSGTPVITSSWGVYGGDTFIDGVHGFKCRSLDDMVFAAQNCHKLDPYAIRKNAERYLMGNIQYEYERWFDDLYNVYLSTTGEGIKGWSKIRTEIPEWRRHAYPVLTKE
jgi:glycosyltransferase involved in cell wall biosynthesis